MSAAGQSWYRLVMTAGIFRGIGFVVLATDRAATGQARRRFQPSMADARVTIAAVGLFILMALSFFSMVFMANRG